MLPIPECELGFSAPGYRSMSVVSVSFWHAGGAIAASGLPHRTTVRNTGISV
jgi:hypothetical protein